MRTALLLLLAAVLLAGLGPARAQPGRDKREVRHDC